MNLKQLADNPKVKSAINTSMFVISIWMIVCAGVGMIYLTQAWADWDVATDCALEASPSQCQMIKDLGWLGLIISPYTMIAFSLYVVFGVISKIGKKLEKPIPK